VSPTLVTPLITCQLLSIVAVENFWASKHLVVRTASSRTTITRWHLHLPVDRYSARISALPALVTEACRRTGSQRHVAFIRSFILWPPPADLGVAGVGHGHPLYEERNLPSTIGLISTFWFTQNYVLVLPPHTFLLHRISHIYLLFTKN